jgi:hypothetical protein
MDAEFSKNAKKEGIFYFIFCDFANVQLQLRPWLCSPVPPPTIPIP